ncbi:hypothetical protein HMPREF2863_03525 [Micrococcus sp. HMSC067E09]|nr:hypothetical protein HMPREF2863_03525 [Micrococcus sp. HMSC067E09]
MESAYCLQVGLFQLLQLLEQLRCSSRLLGVGDGEEGLQASGQVPAHHVVDDERLGCPSFSEFRPLGEELRCALHDL